MDYNKGQEAAYQDPYNQGSAGYPSAPPNYDQHQQGYPAQAAAPQAHYPPQPQPYGGGYSAYPAVASQQVVIRQDPMNDIEDHCTFSIMNTIFCCFWIGICAIMKSSAVRDAKARGDRASAQALSSEALRLNKFALGFGICFTVVYVVVVGVYFGVFYAAALSSRTCYGYYC